MSYFLATDEMELLEIMIHELNLEMKPCTQY